LTVPEEVLKPWMRVLNDDGDRGFESGFLQGRVNNEPCGCLGALPSRNACNGRRRSDRGAGLEFLPNDVREDFGGYLYWNTELQA
jgi:hypothetical protein